jgi:hypothetical protein
MKSDKPLYLVSSRPGATHIVRGSHSHLRLVPAAAASSSASPTLRHSRVAQRSLSRPFGQRVVQAASDAAVLAVALIVGLRPNA